MSENIPNDNNLSSFFKANKKRWIIQLLVILALVLAMRFLFHPQSWSRFIYTNY